MDGQLPTRYVHRGHNGGVFSGNVNKAIHTSMIAEVTYCDAATVTIGTLPYAVRQ